jgi:hypothetical protein
VELAPTAASSAEATPPTRRYSRRTAGNVIAISFDSNAHIKEALAKKRMRRLPFFMNVMKLQVDNK